MRRPRYYDNVNNEEQHSFNVLKFADPLSDPNYFLLRGAVDISEREEEAMPAILELSGGI
jgi:hypothetical protein